jgi:hypothetical protein
MPTLRNRPYTTAIATMTVATIHTANSTMVYAFLNATTLFLGQRTRTGYTHSLATLRSTLTRLPR